MAIGLTPAAVASPPSAMELAAAELLLAVEVLPARQSLAVPQPIVPLPQTPAAPIASLSTRTFLHLFSTMFRTRTVTLHTTNSHNIMNYLLIPVTPIPMYSVEDPGVRARDQTQLE
jgi:hypothetical protein